jgi:uncharacterized membrane protein (GlpM family)
MVPSVHTEALRRTHASGYLIRFGFGGSMTALAGIIAHAYGPAIGGLFLAFPAILPASLTLVASQDGRQSAVEEARGAILGAVGLGAFAASVWLLADKVAPGLALTVAAAVWFVISCTLWWMSNGRRAN